MSEPDALGRNPTVQRVRTLLLTLRYRVSPQLQRRLEIGLNTLLLVLVVVIIYQNQMLLPALFQSLAPQILLLCILFYAVSILVQATIWADLMGYRSGEYRIAIEDYVQTTLMGRLPGGLWKLFGRVTLYRAPRLSVRAIIAINLFEIFLLILAAGVLLMIIVPGDWAGLLLLSAVLIGMSLIAARRLKSFIPGLQRPIAYIRFLGWHGGYTIAWMCGAAIVYYLFVPFSQAPLTFVDALRLTCISGMVNMVFQFLPVSLIFRDITMVALLMPFMSPSQSIVALFALRIVSSMSELAASWILISLVRMVRPGPEKVNQHVSHPSHDPPME